MDTISIQLDPQDADLRDWECAHTLMLAEDAKATFRAGIQAQRQAAGTQIGKLQDVPDAATLQAGAAWHLTEAQELLEVAAASGARVEPVLLTTLKLMIRNVNKSVPKT